MFFAYAIYNFDKEKIYIGHTQNLENRLLRHNKVLSNKLKSYTARNAGTWVILHKEEYATRTEAMQREKELKSYQGRRFLKNLIS